MGSKTKGGPVQNDRRLAARIAGGDRQAREAFVDAYGARLHRLARRYARTEADAEDVTQEIFVALFGSIGAFRGDSALATWVYRVAVNHCLKHRARALPATVSYDEALQAEEDPAGDPARWAARRELGDHVQAALGHLSPEQENVVILHELHGLTYAECAAALCIPLGTVKSRLFHAFARLRKSLDGYVLGDSPPTPNPGGAKPGAATETT